MCFKSLSCAFLLVKFIVVYNILYVAWSKLEWLILLVHRDCHDDLTCFHKNHLSFGYILKSQTFKVLSSYIPWKKPGEGRFWFPHWPMKKKRSERWWPCAPCVWRSAASSALPRRWYIRQVVLRRWRRSPGSCPRIEARDFLWHGWGKYVTLIF